MAGALIPIKKERVLGTGRAKAQKNSGPKLAQKEVGWVWVGRHH